MDFHRPGDMESGVKVFWKQSINLVEIDIDTRGTEWSDGITVGFLIQFEKFIFIIQKIETNHLKINNFGSRRSQDSFFENLKNEKLEIRDHSPTAEMLIDVFKKFQKGDQKIGSFYETNLATDCEGRLWKEVKRGVDAEKKGL